jgi:diguanylate cyclase (GGDEF)-like protein/PAS domain S-box-containing protein
MTTRPARMCYAAWFALLAVVYYAWPASHLYSWSAMGLSGVVAVLAGVRGNRPHQRLPWYLLAGSVFFFTAGDAYSYARQALGLPIPYPGPSDLLYLLVYPLLAAALLLFIRARSGGDNRAALLDALVPTVGLGLLGWVYLVAPYTRATDLTLLQKAVSVGYPLGDVLALAMMLRLILAPGRKPAAMLPLCGGIIGVLVSDVVYGLARLSCGWAVGSPIDVGWAAFYFAAGLCALQPSMTRMSEPADAAAVVTAGARRLALMTVAVLLAPAVLVAQYLLHRFDDVPIIAAGAALMFALVMARVGDLLAAQRRAVARERVLREAGAVLVRATDEPAAGSAVRLAVAELVPAGEPYAFALFSLPDDGPDDDGRTVVRVADLPGEFAAPLHGFALALRLTTVTPGTNGGPALRRFAFLAASAATLQTLRSAYEALMAQGAMALERIALSREIGRRDGEAYFRTLIQSASDIILIVDDADRIRYASPSAGTVLGRDDLTGTDLAGLIAGTHRTALRDALIRARGAGRLDGIDLAAVGADGRVLRLECTARDLRADPTVRGVVLTLRDVTERRRLENDLAHQAFHDGLTGLANRVLFRNRLEHAFDSAARDDAALGVLFVDLDDFKEVNDTLGHAFGDQLLVAVGRRIAQAIGPRNTAARMGGDEFAILVEQSPDPDAAEEVADRIIAALAVPVELADGLGGSHIVSGAASIGVATSRDATGPTELLRHADLALYLAKGAGKGTWQRYRSDLHTAMVERLELRAALHEAVDGDQFVLQYQPIVDLAAGNVIGVESLVRWQHPVRGLLPPHMFVELAEESGAIVEIGAWVLRESLRQFALWQAERPDSALHYVSVNVSARQFRMPGFVEQVRRALADNGARPQWLLLEITESLVLRDAEQVWADLRVLRELGVRIAIDDFGTGYSSLSYLRQMPVDVLKIDKSFIDDVLAGRQQRALVNAIVTLARNLDLAVVAEGIEDAAQRTLLQRMGCPHGQGYLFARPVWPQEIPGLVTAGDLTAVSGPAAPVRATTA